MELSKFDPRKAADENEIEVILRHPSTNDVIEDEDGKNLIFKILGKDSSRWRNAALKLQRKNATNRNIKTFEEVDGDIIEIMSECCTEFPDNLLIEGEAPKNAKEIFTKQQWIAEQVLACALDRSKVFLA